MRRLLFVVLLAACSHAKPSGPAWPEMAKTEPADDGGESIAPHESNAIAAVIEKSEEPEDKKAEPEADKPAATTDDKPDAATTPPPPPLTDDVLNTEEIIIEIDDD